MKTWTLLLFSFIFTIHIFGSNPSLPTAVKKYNPTKFEVNIDLTKVERPIATVNIKAVLVICDHYVTPENNLIAQSLRVDLGTISQVLDVLQKRNIAKVDKIVLQGTKATKANILSTINTLQSGSNDVIFYYFSGHGLMEKGKTYMLTADEQNLGRAEVESIINAKNARLKMLITDACSNAVDGMTASRSINKSGQKIESGAFDEIYRDLFLGYQGMMHLSASTEGELAWSNDNFGGFFTYHFFKEGLIKKPVSDWNAIFNDAKDKTSQMFMRMSAEERSQLAKEGVKNQTAKAFSMPKLKTGSTNIPPPPPPIKTQQPTTPAIPVGNIMIYNYSGDNIQFVVDNNNPNEVWKEAKVKQWSVGVKKISSIKQKYATIGYNFKGQDYYFDLEEGNYFFAIDGNGSLELFYKDDHINESNFTSVTTIDFQSFFLGEWEWDDEASGEVVSTTFIPDIFTDIYDDETYDQSGSWVTRKQEIDGLIYDFITFIYDDEGEALYLDYMIVYDDEYPDQVQLIFVSAFENDVEIPYEEAEEFLEPSVIMYRVE